MKIKICGLSREEDIAYVNEAKPDLVGFVFAKSRRQVFDKQAKKVIGLVSRSSDKHTLIVPVSRIYQLIEEIE
jgi:phosphoribosylanthranilate isomerase